VGQRARFSGERLFSVSFRENKDGWRIWSHLRTFHSKWNAPSKSTNFCSAKSGRQRSISINKTPVQYCRFQTISSCKPSIYPALILSVSAETAWTQKICSFKLRAQRAVGLWPGKDERRKRLPRPWQIFNYQKNYSEIKPAPHYLESTGEQTHHRYINK
jgi:hypothetical protein